MKKHQIFFWKLFLAKTQSKSGAQNRQALVCLNEEKNQIKAFKRARSSLISMVLIAGICVALSHLHRPTQVKNSTEFLPACACTNIQYIVRALRTGSKFKQ